MSQSEKLSSCRIQALVEDLQSFGQLSVRAGLLSGRVMNLSGCGELYWRLSDLPAI